ncbi:MAG: protein kinase [Hormoscilla sp.]
MNRKSQLSKYRILGLVGQGQFGRVFCGCHRQTGQLVALKDLDKYRFPTNKFLRELRFLLSLQHPNIVTFRAIEHSNRGRYLVMDYCEGGTLRTWMESDSPLSWEQNLRLMTEVLAGLDHAHSRGIVHCDIKPDNILLNLRPGGPIARISDFGIARLTQEMIESEDNTGSPAYMAPERFYGQYNISCDIYAVGIMLFELLVGDRPFSGAPGQLMTAHLNQRVEIPNYVPEDLQRVIATALEKLPARRYHTASDMLQAIQVAVERMKSSEKSTYSLSHGSEVLPDVPVGDRAVWTKRVGAPITALAVVSSQETASGKESEDVKSLDKVYWAAGAVVECQIYPDGINRGETFHLSRVHLSESMQKLLGSPQGCFMIAERSIYFLSYETYEYSVVSIGLITKEDGEFVADVETRGRWIAAATSDKQLRLFDLRDWEIGSHITGGQTLTIHPKSIAVELKSAPSQLLVLDSRHVAALASGKTGTQLSVFTRRGTKVGRWMLPVLLDRAIAAAGVQYRLLATQANNQKSLLLIDLKPFRIRQVKVDLPDPKFLAATSWGYVVADMLGKIILLDRQGTVVGKIDVQQQISAIAPFHTSGLMIATVEGTGGVFRLLDLREFDLDLLF